MSTAPHTYTAFPSDTWEVLHPVGSGGQSETFAATHRPTGARVALKRVHARHLVDLKQLELFHREGEVLRTLDHPSIPKILDVFHVRTDDGPAELYIAQTWFEGTTLADVVRNGPRPSVSDLIDWTRALLDILEYLHTRVPPVFHRDIKPSNIIIRPDGSAALIDYGIVATGWSQSDGSTLVGTPGFAAPEQFAGVVSARSDLFGLGTTIWCALTGQVPTRNAETARLTLPEHLPPSLAVLVSSTTALDPNRRPKNVSDARLLLDALPDVTPVPPPSPVRRGARPKVRLDEGLPERPRDQHAFVSDQRMGRTPIPLPLEPLLEPPNASRNPFAGRWMRLTVKPREPASDDAEYFAAFKKDLASLREDIGDIVQLERREHRNLFRISALVSFFLAVGLFVEHTGAAALCSLLAVMLLVLSVIPVSSTPITWPETNASLEALFEGVTVVRGKVAHTILLPAKEKQRPQAILAIDYDAPDGTRRGCRLSYSGREARSIRVGDIVPLLVDPDAPENVVLALRRHDT